MFFLTALLFSFGAVNAETHEYYWTITAGHRDPDCIMREVFLVNGELIGETIRAKPGDRVKVHVTNLIPGTGILYHWHGIKMENPWMDGSDTTQCPIPFGSSFTYDIKIEDEHHLGTFWYHMHSQAMYIDGGVGAFIIEDGLESSSPFDVTAYDREHIMFIQDWNHFGYLNFVSQAFGWGNDLTGRNAAETILVNGKGRFDCVHMEGVDFAPYHCMNYTEPDADCGQLERVTGATGETLRLRLVNNGGHSHNYVQIVGHTMTIVQSAGITMEPLTVDGLYIGPGQNFDVLVTLDQDPGNYWIYIEPLNDNNAEGKDGVPPTGYAILSYTDGAAPDAEPTGDFPTETVAPGNGFFAFEDQLRMDAAVHVDDTPPTADEITKRIHLRFMLGRIGKNMTTGALTVFNDIDGAPRDYPSDDQLLETGFDAYPNMLARRFIVHEMVTDTWHAMFPGDAPALQAFMNDHEPLTTAFSEISLGDVVEVVIEDGVFLMGPPLCVAHTFHMHGYDPWIVATGWGQWNVTHPEYKPLDEVVRRDTVGYAAQRGFQGGRGAIPRGGSCGYVVMRFRATRPGNWLLHCHHANHLANGYKWMLKESLDEMPKMPSNMPYCGPLASPKEIKARAKKEEREKECGNARDGKAQRLCGHHPRGDDDSSSDSSEEGSKRDSSEEGVQRGQRDSSEEGGPRDSSEENGPRDSSEENGPRDSSEEN